jgi:2'-5' RNA ligase
MPKTFQPPKSVQNNAKRGLELRKKYGRGGLSTQEAGKQGIGSGVARARDLANGKAISGDTIKRMVSFFARHEKNKDSRTESGEPGAGMIAHLLWGGDSGRRWAESISKQLDKESKQQKAHLSAVNLLSVAKAYIKQPKPMVYKANHIGVIIALFLPNYLADKLALLDGEAPDELHITLAYLGKIDEVDNITDLLSIVWRRWASYKRPFSANINGIGRFNTNEGDEKTAFIALVDSPIFPEFREDLILTLMAAGYHPNFEHGFIPHITLKYIDKNEPLPMQNIEPQQVIFDTVSLVIGSQRFDIPLGEKIEQKALVEQYGARNSRPDSQMLQQVHDLTVRLGAVCKKDDYKCWICRSKILSTTN